MKVTRWILFNRMSHNGAYSVADYLLPQLALLAVAPVLLRCLGAAQLGIWMLSTAAMTGGLLVSSAFGDAAIKYVSERSPHNNMPRVETLVRCTLCINLCFGALLASVLWASAPLISRHIAHLPPSLAPVCVAALRLGALLLTMRSVEAVYVSTLRALLRYDTAARITVTARVTALLISALLAMRGFGVQSILCTSLALSAASICVLCIALRREVGLFIFLPAANRDTLWQIAGFGFFSWLQTLSSLAFNQLDRIFVGILLGPAAVAVYGICVQAAQPIHAFTSAAFHSLFPLLSSHDAGTSRAEMRTHVRSALAFNVAISAALTLFVSLFARAALSIWLGPAFAQQAAPVLRALAIGFGLLSLNVTAHYSLLAIGKVRELAVFNLVAAAACLALIVPMARRFDLVGIACARFAYGPITWFTYVTLRAALAPKHEHQFVVAAAPALENR